MNLPRVAAVNPQTRRSARIVLAVGDAARYVDRGGLALVRTVTVLVPVGGPEGQLADDEWSLARACTVQVGWDPASWIVTSTRAVVACASTTS